MEAVLNGLPSIDERVHWVVALTGMVMRGVMAAFAFAWSI